MSFCPAFWDWLIDAHKNNSVFSIKAIFDEICQTPTDEDDEDELSKWVRGDGACLFLGHDQKMTDKLDAVSIWANSQNYKQAAISTFLGCSDYYLIAHALAHDRTLVTHEKAEPKAIARIKIPDACHGLGVKCMTPFEMIRASGARFILER